MAMSSFWGEPVIQSLDQNKYIKAQKEEGKKTPLTQKGVKNIKICQKPWNSSIIAYPRFYGGKKLDSFEPILFTVAAMKILILCSNEHKTIHSQPWQNL